MKAGNQEVKFSKKVRKVLTHPLFLTGIFLLVNLVLVIFHEPWRDETNPWQLAKQINLFNIYDVLTVDPHPLTWHVVLAILADLGFSVWIVQALSLAVVTLAFYLFVRHCNLNIFIKILFGLSAGFFYYNGVIARDYSLVVLGLVLVAITYKDRFMHPYKYGLSLIFLSQSHFLVGGVTAILIMGYFIESIFSKQGKIARKKLTNKPWVMILLMTFVSLITVLPMIVSSMQSHALINNGYENANALADFFLSLNNMLFGADWPLTQVMIGSLFIYLLFMQLKLASYYAFSVLYYTITLTKVYSGVLEQKASTLIIIMVFFIWLSYIEKEDVKKIFAKIVKTIVEFSQIVKLLTSLISRKFLANIIKSTRIIAVLLVCLTIPKTVSAAYYDLTNEYSYSYRVSDWINNNLEENAVILVSSNNEQALADTFLAYLKDGREFYDVFRNKVMMEYRCSNENEEKVSDEDFLRIAESLAKERPVYYLHVHYEFEIAQSYEPDEWIQLESFTSKNPTEGEVKFYKAPF